MISQITDDRVEAGEAGEIDAGLGLPRPLEHAAGAGREREHVARLYELVRTSLRVDGDLDRVGTVGGGDAGGHAVARLDGHGERSLQARLVVARHRRQVELRAALRREREADQAAAFLGHEVDALSRSELRRERKIALILAVLVVADDDHLALAQVGDRLLDGRELLPQVTVDRSLLHCHQNPASASFSQVSPAAGLRPATNA